MQIANKELKRRVIEISHKKKLSHISSCLTMIDILVNIYQKKKSEDKVILDNAHAHLAHLIVREEYELRAKDDKLLEDRLDKYGIHCDVHAGCDASGGSLGHGVGIALGMALVDRNRKIYCTISDGGLAEGSIWEAFRIQKKFHVDNLLIILNANGYSALEEINGMQLKNQVEYMSWAKVVETNVDYLPFLKGIQGHYHILTDDEYKQAMEILA